MPSNILKGLGVGMRIRKWAEKIIGRIFLEAEADNTGKDIIAESPLKTLFEDSLPTSLPASTFYYPPRLHNHSPRRSQSDPV